MMMRIIHGRLTPKTWDAYKQAYRDVMAKVGEIPGLRGRWLTRDLDDPDAGYSISLWENEAAMLAYEGSDALRDIILPVLRPFFSGEYATKRCEMRFFEEFR